jgi:hypothetical protein
MGEGKKPMRLAWLLAAAAVGVAGVACGAAGCGGPAAARLSPPARMERVGHGGVPSVVLTPAGAARIGVRITGVVAASAGGPVTVIPYAALLYEPDGRTAVYVNTAPLVYARYFISVARIAGNQVYVSRGLVPGMRVVTVGAEELLGVQNGVGAET